MPANKIYSKEVHALLKHLLERDVLAGAMSKHVPEHKDLGIGNWQPDSRTAAVIAGSADRGDEILLHELVHALHSSDIKPRTARVVDLEKKLPFFRKPDIVYPKHWVDERVDSTYAQGIKGATRTGILADKTSKRRMKDLRTAIPEGGRWSGIPSGSDSFIHADAPTERDAYYYTDSSIAQPKQAERAKELGMFLLDYDVPMELVYPVVERLSGIAQPKTRYTGGRANLHRLREQHNKERRQE